MDLETHLLVKRPAPTRASFVALVLALVSLAVVACGGESSTDDSDKTAKGGGSGNEVANGETASGAGDGAQCCPRDTVQSGCMNLGGPSANGCFKSCDFFNSTNWRVERDATGCEVWRYDMMPIDAGHPDGG